MADFRIKDLTGTATIPATDDYTILDGVSNGTRKINLKTQFDNKANDSEVVHNTGNETIAGIKTFSSPPVMSTQSMTSYTDKNFITDAQQALLTNVGTINITQLDTCSTAAATAEKVVTLGVTALTDGLTFLVSMTNANTSATITFNVDSLGAKNVYDKRGTQITGTLFSNAANEKVLLRYNSTLDGFELLTADFWSARMGMPSGSYINLTLGASGATYTAPADGSYFLNKSAANVGEILYPNNDTAGYGRKNFATGAGHFWCDLPVKKGDVINITYTATGTTNVFRFYYNEGSKP